MDHRRKIVEAFCEECVWAYAIRTHFRELYESSDERSDLLRETAGLFFGDLNLILIEYILLAQCKLTDPASSGKDKDNLTSNYVVGLPWTSETRGLLNSCNKRLNAFREKVVEARRRLVAHLDLRARLQPIGLGKFTRDEEAEFWSALQDFVNAAHSEAIGGPFEIDAAMQGGDVPALVHSLKEAVDYDWLVKNETGFLMRRVNNMRYKGA